MARYWPAIKKNGLICLEFQKVPGPTPSAFSPVGTDESPECEIVTQSVGPDQKLRTKKVLLTIFVPNSPFSSPLLSAKDFEKEIKKRFRFAEAQAPRRPQFLRFPVVTSCLSSHSRFGQSPGTHPEQLSQPTHTASSLLPACLK